jgi:hypothetical protein
MKQGVYTIPLSKYLADPADEPSLSGDSIKDLLFRSPAHCYFNHPRLNPDYVPQEPDGKFDVGSVAHSLFLEGLDNACVIDADDWRTKAAKEAREEAYKCGQVPLLKAQYDEVRAMVQRATVQLGQSELGITELRGQVGDPELTYIWQEDGVWFRARPDWINVERTIMLNYKTTRQSANPNDFTRTILSLGYDISEALHRRGVKALDKIDPKFVFMVQETEAPYLCSFIGLPPEFQAMGDAKVQQGADLWRHCIKSGSWVGYPQRICYPDMPVWASMWQTRATFLDNRGEL